MRNLSQNNLPALIAGWYARHGRHDLPWRHTDDPYHIYLSEIMLQQTQVKTVLERFWEPFLERFPTLPSLAEASEGEVLKAWEGLGYYTRARNLHASAKLCPDGLPESVKALETLPGIGPNTARAVAAFAYREKVAILDANVKRILLRLHALEESTPKQLWNLAEELLGDDPFVHNQAMMDIGAMICLPKNPLCEECPLQEACRGRDDPLRYVTNQKKMVYEDLILHAVVVWDGERIALIQHTEGLYAKLWGFPQVEKAPAVRLIGSVKHGYTRYRVSAKVYEGEKNMLPEFCRFLLPNEAQILPISGLAKKIFGLLGKESKI